MCLLMEGNNFSHTNTFLFESILFFSTPKNQIHFWEGREKAVYPGKPLHFKRDQVLVRIVSLSPSKAQKLQRSREA